MYDMGVPLLDVKPLSTAVLVVATLLGVWILHEILTRVIDPLIHRFVCRTRIVWDELLLGPEVRKQLWRWICIFTLCALLPLAIVAYPVACRWFQFVLRILVIASSAMVISAIINAAFEIMAYRSASAREDDEVNDYDPAVLEAAAPAHSLGGVRQMLQLILLLVTAILIFSVISGKNIVIILSGLGASAAVLMLVFKDSILGLVAGIQLTINDMLRPGDWISMPKYDVNGRVRKVNLTTVKVQNYDNTIVTIPPYQLVSETFQNWRGMERSGGRRVMRSIPIDMTTIRFCSDEETARWAKEEWWGRAVPAMDGRYVNLSVFRAYLEHYLTTLPTLVAGMLMMVREQQPSATGLPLELYFFTSRTDWASYESVQASVIDTVVASTGEFGLRVFQSPTGHDLKQIH